MSRLKYDIATRCLETVRAEYTAKEYERFAEQAEAEGSVRDANYFRDLAAKASERSDLYIVAGQAEGLLNKLRARASYDSAMEAGRQHVRWATNAEMVGKENDAEHLQDIALRHFDRAASYESAAQLEDDLVAEHSMIVGEIETLVQDERLARERYLDDLALEASMGKDAAVDEE